MNKKAIIFLGDSWTRGWTVKDEDGLPEHERTLHNHRWNDAPVYSDNEYCAGFASTINDKYPDIDVYNLSRSGSANQTMYIELMRRVNTFTEYDEVIVVHSLTTPERFTFLRYSEEYKDLHVDDFRVNMIATNETQEMGPTFHALFKAFITHVYNEEARLAHETTLAIVGIQNLCKVHGFKYIFGNAFYIDPKDILEEPYFSNLIDWTNYIHNHRPYDSFAELLIDRDSQLENGPVYEGGNYLQVHQYVGKITDYFAKCFHPNLAGHDIIAEEYIDFIDALYPGFLK